MEGLLLTALELGDEELVLASSKRLLGRRNRMSKRIRRKNPAKGPDPLVLFIAFNALAVPLAGLIISSGAHFRSSDDWNDR